MATALIVAYLLLAALSVVQAVLIGMQTWEHRRFARSRIGKLDRCRPEGRAVLLVPCRGLDVGLEENLNGLMAQDYHDYQVWFIVEDLADPVCPVICRVIAANPKIESRVILAGRAGCGTPTEAAPGDSGQKVHNLLAATADLGEDVQYLAFVDADARPHRHWLRALLAPLGEPEVGAVTGYRWFVPHRPSLANHLLYSMNCNIAMLLGKKAPNHVWGGAWALRRQTFERLQIRTAWQGTLSDDLVASRVIRRSGLRVEFEPASMVASPLDRSLVEMVSFVRRQYIIGRYYAPSLWALALVMTTFANLMLFGSLAATVWGLVSGAWAVWLPGGVSLLLVTANVFRCYLRQLLALDYFPQLCRSLRAARRFDIWAGPLVGLVNWTLLAASAIGRHITWRGITYRLFPGGQIRLVGRRDQLQQPTAPRGEPAVSPEIVVRPLLPYRKAG